MSDLTHLTDEQLAAQIVLADDLLAEAVRARDAAQADVDKWSRAAARAATEAARRRSHHV